MADAVFAERFELREKIGTGGFGTVWRAREISDPAREYALKVVELRHAVSDRLRARFMREAQIMQAVEHENVVRAHGLFEDGEQMGLLMELVDGVSLRRVLQLCAAQDQILGYEVIADLTEGICRGVDAVHAHDIVHRDIKPPNIMIERSQDRRVKVVDFGVARDLEASQSDATTIGRRIGSSLYMSPEHILGTRPGKASDIYAIGCVLFELITMRRTWGRSADGHPLSYRSGLRDTGVNDTKQVLERITTEAPPVPSRYRPDAAPLDAVVARALARDPEARFPSAGALASAVRDAIRRVGAAPEDDDAGPTKIVTIPNLRELRLPVDGPTPSATAVSPVTPLPSPRPSPVWPLTVLAIAILTVTATVIWSDGTAPADKPPAPAPAPAVAEAPVSARPIPREPPPVAEAPEPPPATTPPPPPVKRKRATPRRRAVRPPPPKRAKSAPRWLAKLTADLAALERDKSDAAAVGRLSEAISKAADRVEDPAIRTRIRRRAYSSGVVGDLAGLRRCLALLREHAR